MKFYIKQFKRASEILYSLNSINELTGLSLSRVGIQKIIYLATTLAPIKSIILNFLQFQYHFRGPYSYEIQNTIDHLMALELVKIDSYKELSGNRLLVDYSITNYGEEVINRITKLSEEEEKQWWINTICKASLSYIDGEYSSEWTGLDRIVDLVYQDPNFLETKNKGFKYYINLSNNNPTTDLINFIKKYLDENIITVTEENSRMVAELLILAFLEFYFAKNLLTADEQ